MTLFSGKLLIRHAIAAGAILAAGTFTTSPLRAADDLPVVDVHVDEIEMPALDYRDRPPSRYEERPYERSYPERPYRPGPFGSGSDGAIPSARLDRPMDARPMLPPSQVMTVLRSLGYSPLGRMTQRGWIYTVAALDPRGDDGRLIIDARTGRIMRFIPALDVDARLNDRMTVVYGPPGPPPEFDANRRGALLDLQHSPRPPVVVPKTAQRPLPKAAGRVPHSTTAPSHQQAAAPAQQAAAPATNASAAAKPAPAVTVVEKKPAKTVGAAAASAPQPSELKLWPTQAMPDVQPLE